MFMGLLHPLTSSYAQVKFWVGEFKRGRTFLEDEARYGRPLDATDEEICKKLVYSGGGSTTGIRHFTWYVSTILHDRLGMYKLTTRWVPKSQSNEQMATRASVCSALLKSFRPKDDFHLRLMTIDETWVHYYEPENKAQSRQSVGPESPRPKKFKTQPAAGKVMATVFYGRERRYYIGRFTKRSTITGVY